VPREPKPGDHRAVLGVDAGASMADARLAYYRRARLLHPDHHPDASAEERARLEEAMVALNLAWAAFAAGEAAADEPVLFADAVVVPAGFVLDRRWRVGVGLRLDSTGAALAGLRGEAAASVASLNLSRRDVGDHHLGLAADLPTLRRLDLSWTHVTDAGVAILAERYPSVRDLDLSGTAVADGGLGHLAALPTLHAITLVDTGITDAGLAVLAGLGGLEILNLRGTAVLGHGLQHLAGLPRLRLLSVPRLDRAVRRAFAAQRPDVEIL
jgi:hypothetical protein